MNRVLGLLAILGFTASAVVHLLSYAGYAVIETLPALRLLHLGAFIVSILVLVILTSAQRPNEGVTWLLESLPVWIIPVIVIGSSLVFVSALAAMLDQPGVPRESGGRYFLVNKGKVVREISEKEFHRVEVLEDRAVSAAWMFFYGFAAIVFLVIAPRIDAERDRASLPAP